MTAKELATTLTGREYGMEISLEETQAAKEAGLVVVYGYSDDNVEFCGAINEEIGAYDGTVVYLSKDGILFDPECDGGIFDECPYYAAAKNAAKTIKAVWHDRGNFRWTFETDIPHDIFIITEDREPWCEGIIFSINDLEENHDGKL